MKDLHIFDIEADGLLDTVTKLHCFLSKEYNKDNFNLFIDLKHEEAEEAINWIKNKDVKVSIHDFSELSNFIMTVPKALACHNMFGYDLKILKRFFNLNYDLFCDQNCLGTINGKQITLFDTLSMSRNLYPDRQLPVGCIEQVKNPVTGKMQKVGAHGLEAWGFRVAKKKVKIDDWRDQPLWEYVSRCFEDVLINEMTYTYLIQESRLLLKTGDNQFFVEDLNKRDGIQQINWKTGLRRGMLTDFLFSEQEEVGVKFDIQKAKQLVVQLDKEMGEIADEIEPKLPKKRLSKSQMPTFPAKPFIGNGEISSQGYNWLEKLGYNVNREYFDKIKNKPPEKLFSKNGDLTKTALNWASKQGCESKDIDVIKQFLLFKKEEYTKIDPPLKETDLENALEDLRSGKIPEEMYLTEMHLSNQGDIKDYLISVGWIPTLFRILDITRGQNKITFSEEEQEEKLRKYIDDLQYGQYSNYSAYILKELELPANKLYDTEYLYSKLLKKKRRLLGSPQLRDPQSKELCSNLKELEGDLAKQIVRWLSLRNRRSVLDPLKEENTDTGWLNHPRLQIDGRLPAATSGLTNTRRQKHKIVANVPKVSSLYGKEFRSLFIAERDYYMIGTDASNLEGMIASWAAYEFDHGEYAKIMLSCDNHSRMAEIYTVAAQKQVSRDKGKGITYAIMYGAQCEKIARMLSISKSAGQKLIDMFWDSNYGLKKRKESLERFYEATGNRYIYGIDGSKIYCRSKHSLLNAYQQNGGAMLFNLALIIFHQQAYQKLGWDKELVRRVIYYHDESQIETHKSMVNFYTFNSLEEADKFISDNPNRLFALHKKEEKDKDTGQKLILPRYINNGRIEVRHSVVGELMVKSIEKSAEIMGSPVKITGEYIIGRNWSETH